MLHSETRNQESTLARSVSWLAVAFSKATVGAFMQAAKAIPHSRASTRLRRASIAHLEAIHVDRTSENIASSQRATLLDSTLISNEVNNLPYLLPQFRA